MQVQQPIKHAKTIWENDSLVSETFGDIYFSVGGGRKETTEVYFNGNQLTKRFLECANFVIGEIGFGTALNFALTLELWKKHSNEQGQLFYLSYEKYPVESSQIKKVLLSQGIDESLIEVITSRLPLLVESVHVIDLPEYRTRLLLYYGDAAEKLKETTASVDAWFLDGFSPTKNPECWSKDVLHQVSRLSHNETTAATYSVSSIVRERLKELNWDVQKVAGSGSKKEILTAKFNGPKKSPIVGRNLRVCIVGAGLVGCALAESFSRRGAKVSLYESRPGLAQAASGNELGVVLPYPSRGRDLPHRLYTTAYLYLTSVLDRFEIERSGVLFQPLKDRTGGFLEDYSRYEYPSQYAQILSAIEASAIAGVEIKKDGLFFPAGGAISFLDLCKKLVGHSSAVYFDTPVNSINALARDFDLVILASGSNFELFPSAIKSFVYPLKGEVGSILESDSSKNLKVSICDGGIVCPSRNGAHFIGSTYQRDVSDELLSGEGEQELGKLFTGIFPQVETVFVSRRAGVRVACKDRMPIVGEVESGVEGLRMLISTAHGSRGGVTALLSAEILAARIFSEPEPLDARVARAIGVARIKF